MIEIWKTKAPKQANWFCKHPVQVARQAKRVWKWSLDAGDGCAWLYFIFAVCQWLPTNRRVFYKDKSSMDRQKCQLCSTGHIERIGHVWRCPAFEQERHGLRQTMVDKIRKWNLPFA